MPLNGIGAVLGVFEGQFSTELYKALKPRKLHLIDPSYHLSSHCTWAAGKPSIIAAQRRILRHCQPQIEAGQVLVHVDTDLEVLQRFVDGYLDWVYIDTSHAYEHTKHELEVLRRKVKLGGCIAGNDWRPDPNHPHHGVSVAVQEAVDAGYLEPRLVDEKNAQWVTTLLR